MEVTLVGRVCPCQWCHTWSLFFCQKAIEEVMWATPGLGKAEIPAASSYAPLVRAMTQSPHTVPQRNSSMCMWITWVSWERHV